MESRGCSQKASTKHEESMKWIRGAFWKGNKMRLVLTLLHQRNSIRRQEKTHVGVEKTQRYTAHAWCQEGDAARTAESGRAVNHGQHRFKQTGAGRACICQGQLKGHGSSQDTRHQAETTNLGLQTGRKHLLKGSSEAFRQGLDTARDQNDLW